VGVFPLLVASPVFDSVRQFAINTTVRRNGKPKITVCLYTDCLALAKGTAGMFISAQQESEYLETYVT